MTSRLTVRPQIFVSPNLNPSEHLYISQLRPTIMSSSTDETSEEIINEYVTSLSTNHGKTRVTELELKVREANKTRIANYTFPQPASDRFFAWIISMIVMTMELEQQEKKKASRSSNPT